MVDLAARFRVSPSLFNRARALGSQRSLDQKVSIIALEAERAIKNSITQKGAVDTGRLRASVGTRRLRNGALVKAGGSIEDPSGVGVGRRSGRDPPAISIPVEYAPIVEDRVHFFRDSLPEIRRKARKVMQR